jgi:ribosomal protein S18 acetylase RimI-like enzyme
MRNADEHNLEISFRQITFDDFDFLWRLHNAALREYVEKTWGWDEERQRRLFAESFDANNGEIIVIGGADAGYLWTAEREMETILVSIRILPEYQNRGIGKKIIEDVLVKSKKPVRLQVLKINPAQNLYKRLGFETISETETHFLMKTKSKKH